jgi:RNA polymerase sigma factor (sigma-70 family)
VNGQSAANASVTRAEVPAARTAHERHAIQRWLDRGLAEELAHLPERERRVLELYYVEALNMKEVGAVLGVTESRVCQIHAQAASRLRSALAARLHATGVAASFDRRT